MCAGSSQPVWRHSLSASPGQETEYPWVLLPLFVFCYTNSASLLRCSKQHERFEITGAVVAPAFSSSVQWTVQRAELVQNWGVFFVSFPFFILSWAFFCQVSSPWVWLWMGGEGWATGSSTCIDLQRSKTSPWDSFMPLKLVSTTDYCRKIKKNFRTTCLIYCALESLYSHVYFPYFIVGTAI